MKLIYVFFVWVIFFLVSCGHKNEHYRVSLKNDGKIQQKSETKSQHLRLHLSFSPKGWEFSGVETITSFESINQRSLPKERHGEYYGVVIRDKNKLSLHKDFFKKSYYYETSKERPDYWVSFSRGGLFFDISTKIDLSTARSLDIIDLKDDKIISSINIEDIKKPFKENKTVDGWSGEKAVFKIYGDKPAEQAFDLVVLTEGFSKEEIALSSQKALMESKFGKYAKEYILPLLETEPFSSLKENINIWVVATPSVDSGVSNLIRNINKRTVYSAAFGINCFERALVVRDQKRALKMASETPFDQILVLVNSETYGGIGHDIATFSVHKEAHYLIKHELAHSIGMLADEYNSFSDGLRSNNLGSNDLRSDDLGSRRCEDHGVVSHASHKHKTWGGNTFFEDDKSLAPNLTLFDDPKKAKWAHLLKKDSPIVYFDYAKKQGVYLEKSKGFSWDYSIQKSRSELLLTIGLSGYSYNNLVQSITDVNVNGSSYKFVIEKVGEIDFVRIADFPVKEGDEINVVLKFKDDAGKYILDYSDRTLSSKHFLTLPSRTFTGVKNEVGLFQGSHVDLVKTFRASFDSIMGESDQFNSVQKEAYRKQIEYYISNGTNGQSK